MKYLPERIAMQILAVRVDVIVSDLLSDPGPSHSTWLHRRDGRLLRAQHNLIDLALRAA